ncbi:WecB/TagA/CpsF family glycosyltransferase [Candidatus Daviesbacteria bacterium]|nr:WecB/TagA/CpsF family glycosyltransferase [Candidatus Daviesbacteria bacterium]
MKKDVLGIKIDDVNINQAVEVVFGWLKEGGRRYIVTPNPEIVVMAQKDQELKNILNNADLVIPDGVGLKIATDIVCNTPGIDLMEALIKLSNGKGFTTAFLGGKEGVAEKAAECLLRKYPNLKISFTGSGGEINENGELIGEDLRFKIYDLRDKNVHKSLIVNRKSLPKADLLFIGFGPPKQEKWIAKNLNKLPVKIAMVVGGSLDYLSGQVPRAPKFIRSLGLEWLFRLIIQPWRIRRQLALLKYLWLIWTMDGGK